MLRFVLQPTRSCCRGDSLMLAMAYDGTGRRVSKTRERKACVYDEADGVYAADWERELVTHYTGIGTEVRENYRNNALENAKVVVNMPNGLGRYGVSDVILSDSEESSNTQLNEFYLKNHLGSTMLVYGTQGSSNADVADLGEVKKAYDYRSFGEQIDLIADAGDKVTENFTGKEKDDETELNYFGARYLNPMIGMWTSVDPARQFASPYLYVGNGMNPISSIDPDGNAALVGAALGVAGGMAFAFAESYRSNQPFHYSLADCITDAAVGALGFGAIKNFGKAASALSNMEKIKTAGKSLRRPRWKNEFNAAKKRT